ncbi:MAG: SRPBCC family protein [Haliscomenobacteraceae bacterium CHB4]|nr:hypothetical protein [Saprospiraceae bacterium]MCE7926537.1 SRPBCC family protein [Haliscomenobacteraceae bacterium CHB4]
MRAIQRHLPNPRHTEINRIFVKAKPDAAWETARHFDASDIPWVRLLFDIRALPDLLTGKRKEEDRSIGVDQVARQGTGFMILEEVPGREVVVGSVGQFWHLNIPFAPVAPADFRDFNEPGWGKLAWAIAVEPCGEGSTVSLELRTTATDDESWEKLQRYYSVIGIGSRLIRHSGMAHLEAEMGKMKRPDVDEIAMPGDERIPGAKYQMTHHRDIEAPPSIVWRYLMQLGCDRGGWYSIDALDNGGVPSIDHLVEGWESRAVGDRLSATPAQDGFFEVYAVEKERFFVIGGESDHTMLTSGPFKMSWSFVLEPIGADATRLITRARGAIAPKWAEWLMGAVIYPPVHAIMQIAELKNIKRLAERDAHKR